MQEKKKARDPGSAKQLLKGGGGGREEGLEDGKRRDALPRALFSFPLEYGASTAQKRIKANAVRQMRMGTTRRDVVNGRTRIMKGDFLPSPGQGEAR